MRVLVTGGMGFIGSHLVDRCLAMGWKTAIMDNLSFGHKDVDSLFAGRPEFFRGDVANLQDVERIIEAVSPELVFHLAALHYIPYCNAHPAETVQTNSMGTAVLAEACKRADVERLVLASTGALYPAASAPLPESRPAAPTDVYGLSKHLAEEICRFYASPRLRIGIARIFNVYGTRETNAHIIPHLIDCVKAKRFPIPLGNVDSKRDYIHVEDVVSALVRLASIPAPLSVLNVGTGVQHSVQEVVGILERIVGKPIPWRIETSRVRPTDKPFQCADSTALRQLGWAPRYDLESGLRELAKDEGFLPT